jgi:hypothetical protein
VDDRSIKAGGRQCLTTLEGYVIPLDIINGLPYMKMKPPTDEELRTLPHIIMTSGDKWDPSQLDLTLSDKEDWYNTICKLNEGILVTPFDEFGNYKNREPIIGSSNDDEKVNDKTQPPLPQNSEELPDLLEEDSNDEDYENEDDISSESDSEYIGALHEFTTAFHDLATIGYGNKAFVIAT